MGPHGLVEGNLANPVGLTNQATFRIDPSRA